MRLTFHNDPGHGWLAVPMELLHTLGIAHEISRYSYHSNDGKTAYLEEDCDYSRFVAAAKVRDIRYSIEEKHSERDSFVRNLPSYQPPRAPEGPAVPLLLAQDDLFAPGLF